jgi:hypothetical protein
MNIERANDSEEVEPDVDLMEKFVRVDILVPCCILFFFLSDFLKKGLEKERIYVTIRNSLET